MNPSAQWDWLWVFQDMSTLGRLTVVFLFLQMLWLAVILINRSLRLGSACRQSRRFAPAVSALLCGDQLDEAMVLAQGSKKSHIAGLVAGALADYLSVLQGVPDAQVIDIVKRGMKRAANLARASLRRGMSVLATIASTAPFVGLFGTVLGIVNAFRGCACERSTGLAMVAAGIAESLLPTALGLLVAVPAVWAYNFFSDKLEIYDIEMECASRELETYFILQLVRRKAAGRG